MDQTTTTRSDKQANNVEKEKEEETRPVADMEYTQRLKKLLEVKNKLSPRMSSKIDMAAKDFLVEIKFDARRCTKSIDCGVGLSVGTHQDLRPREEKEMLSWIRNKKENEGKDATSSSHRKAPADQSIPS